MIIRGDEPVIIIRRTQTGTNAHGNPTYSTSEILVRDALFAVGSTTEPADVARDHIDSRVTLYLPHGTVIQDGDVFEIRGSRWEKDGDALDYPTVNGFEVGVVVNVKRRRG
ncbi:MAG TPA: hypothetical protein VK149_04355 [Sideroxyarcus sp.]|nr:hypothetical protein [Sideroxyarcus sp.]